MRFLTATLLAALLALGAGCSDESVAPDPTATSGTLQGTIGDSDFELVLDATGDPLRPLEGPFVLRGSNVHYVDSLHALSVDLTVTNRGRVRYGEPIGLTFLRLYPDSVTVLNPDNGDHDAGAAIVFQFANDDGLWTPGERSLPRTVQFDVDEGVAIAFIARLDIGMTPTSGVIAGRVWHDADEDGVADPEEGGMPGLPISLRLINDVASDRAVRQTWTTLTGADGRYEFNRLAAGVYTVSALLATPRCRPTTPTEITVVLTSVNGDVSDFLGADFGCVPLSNPPIPIGAWIDAKGTYHPDPEPYLAATDLLVSECGDDSAQGPLDPATTTVCEGGVLRGPVTEVADDGHSVKVMSTWIAFRQVPNELKPGARIEVRVTRAGNVGGWAAVEWGRWTEEHEGVTGRVEDAVLDNGIMRVRVVDVWVVPLQIVGVGEPQ